jgi:hypothetical protein
MPPILPESEAGPSKKRISTFKSTSDGESGSEEEELVVKRKKSRIENGSDAKRQKLNGHLKDGKGKKLKERAGELLEMRQELPFYQGMYNLMSDGNGDD